MASRNRRKRKSKNIIHVSIRSTKNQRRCSRSESNKQGIQSSSTTKIQSSCSLISSQIILTQLNQNEWANHTDYIDKQNHLPNQKKKKLTRRYCFIATLVIASILIAVGTILLVVLLNKSKPRPKPIAIPVLRWKPEAITVAGITGSYGSNVSQLYQPFYVKVDYLNSMYIADRLNHRIQKYLKDAKVGTTVAGLSNGTQTSTLYGFTSPSQVLIDSNDNLYITDTLNHRVQFWKKGASSGKTVAGTTGVQGNASNQLNLPYGTAYDLVTETLYIAEYGGYRVMSYASGATSGVLVAGGNGPGLNNTQSIYPVGMHFDSFTNSLIIANYNSNKIVRWKLGDDHWTLLAGSAQGFNGTSAALLNGPTFITLDPMGNLYVADRHNHRIQMFAKTNFNGTTIAGRAGLAGNNSNMLNLPWSVEFDNQLNLYVADALNHRIQKFSRY